MLSPETCCPAGTQNSESIENPPSSMGDGSSEGDDRSCSGDSNTDEFVIINGKQIPIVRMSLDDILHRSETMLRLNIYEERGILIPEFKLAT